MRDKSCIGMETQSLLISVVNFGRWFRPSTFELAHCIGNLIMILSCSALVTEWYSLFSTGLLNLAPRCTLISTNRLYQPNSYRIRRFRCIPSFETFFSNSMSFSCPSVKQLLGSHVPLLLVYWWWCTILVVLVVWMSINSPCSDCTSLSHLSLFWLVISHPEAEGWSCQIDMLLGRSVKLIWFFFCFSIELFWVVHRL